MALQLTAQSGRIIISKPGYDANPSLPDAFKIFDSNWFATGGIIAAGSAIKSMGLPLTIPFTPLHYVPAALVMNNGFALQGTVTTSSIILDVNTAPGECHYVVWSVSQ
nr:hypothetical protein REQ54_00845 [Rhizobium sp. Q54]